ncbi:protoglobin domain-containing protein [Marinobacterium sediminicola]|uniref:Protoglobin n=1 Tax=Marinobacterium sediminicola TaxID=518898 RepID=A0ABY1S479_9GAMM|nr:protoglobin domain-containing protein [Marinobacterium sediminicola]ULG68938.1 protoglobin domain-containing protein [Marinobacterium sediminicola]SMR78441.1 Protoglobin [Marinobacterium sediminicola]
MRQIDFSQLNHQAKQFSGFEPEDEQVLMQAHALLTGELDRVTDAFYQELGRIEEAQPFLEGRLEALKSTHRRWLERIFSGPYDEDFAAYMHHVGVVHVQVRLPERFMASGIGLIGKHLIPVLTEVCGADLDRLSSLMKAVNAVTTYCLIIMQVSYREHELARFMDVTGISEALYANLAAAYREKNGSSSNQ